MTVDLYTIYDRVSMEGGPIFQARNNAVAIRAFKQLLDKDGVNHNDFRLYRLGSYDTDKMAIMPLSSPQEVFSPGESVPNGSPEPLIGVGG